MSAPTDPLATLKSLVGQSGSGFVKIGVPDIDGVLRGQYMSKKKFLASLDGGFGFCEVVLGWDAADQLYDNTAKTGWHSGYGDVPVRILPETAGLMPTEPGVVFFWVNSLASSKRYAHAAPCGACWNVPVTWVSAPRLHANTNSLWSKKPQTVSCRRVIAGFRPLATETLAIQFCGHL